MHGKIAVLLLGHAVSGKDSGPWFGGPGVRWQRSSSHTIQYHPTTLLHGSRIKAFLLVELVLEL